MLVLEQQGECHGHHKSIRREDEPCRLPAVLELGTRQQITAVPVAVLHDDLACDPCSDRCADTVGHQHEQTLSAALHRLGRLLLREHGTRHVEEVERHAVYYAREEQRRNAHRALGRTDTEQPEAQHPCQHSYKHYLLYSETYKEIRCQQNAERLRYLRNGYQHRRILGKPAVRRSGEAVDIWRRIAVGNLQRDAQQHREYEEHRHFALLEQHERIQSQALHQRLRLLVGRAVERTLGQREAVSAEQKFQHAAYDQLHVSELGVARKAERRLRRTESEREAVEN